MRARRPPTHEPLLDEARAVAWCLGVGAALAVAVIVAALVLG